MTVVKFKDWREYVKGVLQLCENLGEGKREMIGLDLEVECGD